jgi:hypothetical protein
MNMACCRHAVKSQSPLQRYTFASPNNRSLELTAHNAGFCGYSWRFPLWAAAQRER